MSTISRLLTLVIGIAAAAPVVAQTAAALNCQRSFGFRADTNSVIGATICSSKSGDFTDALEKFDRSNPAHTTTSSVLVQGRFSDVRIVLDYAASSTTLNYNFVEL